MFLIGSVVGLLVTAGALWFVMFSGDEEVAAKNDEAVAAADDTSVDNDAAASDATDAGADNGTDGATDEGAGDDAAGSDEPNASDDDAGAASDAGSDAGDGAGDAAGDEAASGDASDAGAGDEVAKDDKADDAASAPKADVDLNEVDLSTIADYGPIEGVDDERWADLQKWAAQMIDPNAGAAGNRARNKLIDAGKAAFPAVLNELKALDFTTDQGRKDGDLCQRVLMELCNGNNFGWKYTTEPADALFNKKVVRSWSVQWDKAKDSEEYWLRLSKQKGGAKKDDEADAKRKKALDALDDI